MPQYQGIWTLAQAAQLQSTQRWATDPLFENTTLLLQADNAANGAQNNTFLDSSSNNFTITRNGNTTQGTFSPFSATGWSNFASAASASVGFSNATAALVGSTASTFTAECWIYMTDAPVSGDGVPALIGMDATFNSSIYLGFGPNASQKLVLRWFDGASKTATGSTTLALNTWYHIAVVANSNALAMYVNGVPEVLTGTTTLTNRNATTNTFSLFLNSSGSNYQFRGYASNIRVCTSAVYTGAFTPSTSPLTTTSQGATNCRLLTCQDNRFIDNSSNAYVLTLQSTPSVQAFSPFAPQYQYTPSVTGGSGYFDGTGDSLTMASSSAFAVGTVFTMECWIYPLTSGTSAGQPFFVNGTTAEIQFGYQGATSWGIAANNVVWRLTSSTMPFVNAWNHVVVVRSGLGTNQTSLFLNGTRVANGTVADTFTSAGTGNIGLYGSGTYTGYISSLRIVKGTAVYDPSLTTCTVPTAPLTAITNTQLLTNFTNAGIYDGTLKNNLETVGNAQVSTAVVKYGTGSMYFDGSLDWLTTPLISHPAYLFQSTADWTLEFWFNTGVTSGTMGLVDTYYTNSAPYSGLVVQIINGTINVYDGGSNRATTTTYANNTWQHFAWVNSNGTSRVYMNGVNVVIGGVTSWATSSNIYRANAPIQVGRDYQPAYFNGYIDDLRITKFARYTANFIPPSVALPRQ